MNKEFLLLLFSIVISTFLLSQSYSAAISFAQTESVLVCDFVKYCSNPSGSSTNDNDTSTIASITPEINVQTMPDSSELLPDVKSNISLIMTPDLPGNLAEEVSQDPVNQDLLTANETQLISSNATLDSQLVVPENATVMTPSSRSSPSTLNENIANSIRDGSEINTSSILWKNHTSEKHDISLEYPSGAAITEGRESPYDPEKDLVIQYFPLGFSFAVLESDINPSILEEFSKNLLDSIVNDYDYETYKIPIQEVTPMHINNRTFYSFIDSSIDKETDKSKTVQQSYLTSNGNRTYYFVFTLPPESMNPTKGIRDHMIKSIQFLEQNTIDQQKKTFSSIDEDIIRNFVINDDNPGKDPIISHCELMNKDGINIPPKDCMYEYYDLMVPDYRQQVFK